MKLAIQSSVGMLIESTSYYSMKSRETLKYPGTVFQLFAASYRAASQTHLYILALHAGPMFYPLQSWLLPSGISFTLYQ